MAEDLANNPFTQYFESVEEAVKYSLQCDLTYGSKRGSKRMDAVPQLNKINDETSLNEKIERIFGITIDKNCKNQAVFLENLAKCTNKTDLGLDLLDEAIAERLKIEEPTLKLLNKSKKTVMVHVIEKRSVVYLYQCYENLSRVVQARGDNEELQAIVIIILNQVAKLLKHPGLHASHNIFDQFLDVFSNEDCSKFLDDLVNELLKSGRKENVRDLFIPFIQRTHAKLFQAMLGSNFVKKMCLCLGQLAKNEVTADMLLDYATPKESYTGFDYSKTLFGVLLNISCLPAYDDFLGDYFMKECSTFQCATESTWAYMSDLHQSLCTLFYNLLKVSPEIQKRMLFWINDCVNKNKALGKMWRAYAPLEALRSLTVTVGFMVNLGSVLLLLCRPIIEGKTDQKILKIDPAFGSTENYAGLTPLVSVPTRPTIKTYCFVTEIFFLTHKTIDLGFRVCCELYLQSVRDMGTLYSALREAREVNFHEAVKATEDQIAIQSTVMQTYYATVLEPNAMELLLKLNATTSKWIIQVLLDEENEPRSNYRVTALRKLTFPISNHIPATMGCIPELMVENLNWYLSLVPAVKEEFAGIRDLDVLAPILSLVIILTRGKDRVRNPHLRARLFTSLEYLIAKEGTKQVISNVELFYLHPHADEIIPSLLDVFNNLEVSSENVHFEEKFKYRHSIYILIEVLWKHEIHRKRLNELAREAEQNIDAVDPPIFLRFFNLLINDAVFLLDEALSNMAQLKNMEQIKARLDFLTKSYQEKSQFDDTFRQIGDQARFANILGKWTMKTLKYLTSEIQSVILHPTMVDRVAAMLNSVLDNFVGPKRKNLTVKDKKEYEFNPGEIVLIICQIYTNLSKSDAFCLAISQDDRSYSPRLFVEAEKVLCRIGGSNFVPEIREVAAHVATMASKQKRQEEIMADAPEEFFDPIMSTLMKDPVILPKSNVTIDRATIARHLLSDQTDPFNRTPLTMDMIVPNVALRKQIEDWIANRCEDK